MGAAKRNPVRDPAREWPRSGSLSIQLKVEITPLRIPLFDQPQLPVPPPFFDRVFATARVQDAIVGLVPDQDVNPIVAGEAGRALVLVLPNARDRSVIEPT